MSFYTIPPNHYTWGADKETITLPDSFPNNLENIYIVDCDINSSDDVINFPTLPSS